MAADQREPRTEPPAKTRGQPSGSEQSPGALEARKQEDVAQVRNANPHPQRLLTVKEVAALLNFSQRWVHERTRLREIPCYRFGAALRFNEDEVWRWLTHYHASADNQGDPT